MLDESLGEHCVAVDRSKAQGRKRRMTRGLRRWHLSTTRSWRLDEAAAAARRHHAAWRRWNRSTQSSPRQHLIGDPGDPRPLPWWPVALLLLTNKSSMQEAYGAVRSFFQQLRDKHGQLTYCWWLELTDAGMPHVHAMILNPPPDLWDQEARPWYEAAWGGRFTKVIGRDLKWFAGRGVGYALQYAKKIGDKAYQQEYEELPRELRTFGTTWKDHPLQELLQHEDRWEAGYVRARPATLLEPAVPPHLDILRVTRHVGGPCSLRHVTKSEALSRRSRGRGAAAYGSPDAQGRAGIPRNKAPCAPAPRSCAASIPPSVKSEKLLNVQLNEELMTAPDAPATLIEQHLRTQQETPEPSIRTGRLRGLATKEASCSPPSPPA